MNERRTGRAARAGRGTEPNTPVLPPLPVLWRPRLGRLVPHVFAAVAFGVVLVVALVIPLSGPADRVGLVAVGAALAAALYYVGRCRLRAGPDGLTVVNVLRTTELDWAAVLDARMEPGEPWPTLDLADGTTIAAMGIQAADGARARQALAGLQALIARHAVGREPGG